MEKNNLMLQLCYHCGNEGLMESVGKHQQTYGGPILNKYGKQVDVDMLEYVEWRLLSCPVCKKVSLVQKYSNECDYNPNTNEYLEDIDLLYPECNVNYLGVPGEVKSAFEAALKVKNIDRDICLLSLRRVLEAICKEQGAKGKDLDSMIKNLLEKGTLPIIMEDACWIIRQLGNNAAHAGEIRVYKSDVEQTIDFLKTIIHYLYTLPKQMEQLKVKIERRKEKQKRATISKKVNSK